MGGGSAWRKRVRSGVGSARVAPSTTCAAPLGVDTAHACLTCDCLYISYVLLCAQPHLRAWLSMCFPAWWVSWASSSYIGSRLCPQTKSRFRRVHYHVDIIYGFVYEVFVVSFEFEGSESLCQGRGHTIRGRCWNVPYRPADTSTGARVVLLEHANGHIRYLEPHGMESPESMHASGLKSRHIERATMD